MGTQHMSIALNLSLVAARHRVQVNMYIFSINYFELTINLDGMP